MGQRVLACSVLFFLGSIKGTSCRDFFRCVRTQQSLFFGLAYPVLLYMYSMSYIVEVKEKIL
jgi:hypothetical protein